jgi:GTPase SAR1 family protein
MHITRWAAALVLVFFAPETRRQDHRQNFTTNVSATVDWNLYGIDIDIEERENYTAAYAGDFVPDVYKQSPLKTKSRYRYQQFGCLERKFRRKDNFVKLSTEPQWLKYFLLNVAITLAGRISLHSIILMVFATDMKAALDVTTEGLNNAERTAFILWVFLVVVLVVFGIVLISVVIYLCCRRLKRPRGDNVSFKKSKEINILVLGEPCVGKTSLVQALVMYMKCDTLDKVLNLGENEHASDSCVTLLVESNKTTSYVVKHKNQTLRLIDTPGVASDEADTLSRIISSVAKYHLLHGVIVVVKSTTSRKTANSDYFFSTVLPTFRAHAENMYFCLTFSAENSFRHSVATSILKKYTGEHLNSNQEISLHSKIFLTDNKLLQFVQDGVRILDDLSESDQLAARLIWERVPTTMATLMLEIQSKQPFSVKTLPSFDQRKLMSIREITTELSNSSGAFHSFWEPEMLTPGPQNV